MPDAGRTAIIGSAETGLYTTANQLACTKTTTCTAWRNDAQYGPDVEVWSRVSTRSARQSDSPLHVCRARHRATTVHAAHQRAQLARTRSWLERFDNGATVARLTISQELAAGDIQLLRVPGLDHRGLAPDGGTWSRLGVVQDATYAAAGFAGVGMRGTTGRLDDFGARSTSFHPPGAPTALLGARRRRAA